MYTCIVIDLYYHRGRKPHSAGGPDRGHDDGTNNFLPEPQRASVAKNHGKPIGKP